MATLRPPVGTPVLVEPAESGTEWSALTGVVADDDRLVIDIGASPRPPRPSFDVVASFFLPDALLRASGRFAAIDDGAAAFELVVKDVERVQRRAAARVDVELPAALSLLDGPGPVMSVPGRTRNISSGGCRIHTADALPPGGDPTVFLELGDGPTVVARAAVLETVRDNGGFDYRLVFTEIELDDRVRIASLVTR